MLLTTRSQPDDAVPWLRIWPLAFSQLVVWGVFYYAFAVIVGPMGGEMGWTMAEMNGALSLGLAISGLGAYPVGRWIDRHGGRRLMMAGATLGVVSLLLWSRITMLWQLYAVWALIGIACAMTLYEAAFAVVARLVPGSYRRAIIAITLLGGLASTAFIPLTHWLADSFGWRDALLILAFIAFVVGVGVPWLVLPGTSAAAALATTAPLVSRSALFARLRHEPVFWLLLASYVSFAFFYSSLLFNLLPLLTAKGLSMAGAVALYALIGPAQVVGRLVIFAIDRMLPIAIAGLAATLLPLAAITILIAVTPGSGIGFLFPILFGAGMGIKTVVQATAAPEFLGIKEYGSLQGAIATPVQLVQAASPFVAALLWQWAGGYELLQWLLLASAGVSASAFGLAAMTSRKRQNRDIALGSGLKKPS
jgi:MFS family permease